MKKFMVHGNELQTRQKNNTKIPLNYHMIFHHWAFLLTYLPKVNLICLLRAFFYQIKAKKTIYNQKDSY